MTLRKRFLDLPGLLHKKSFFLFGARSTGKTTLIEEQLEDCYLFDLLDAETFQTLLKRPKYMDERCRDSTKIVVIDEMQKLPRILDEVQRLIKKRSLTFLLTGSSARKLKRGGANLLAGRAWTAFLFPLTYAELPDFSLTRYLNRGGLPNVYDSTEPHEELRSYVGTYLKEEIQAEALTRNVQAFAEFLDLIALRTGEEISLESLASDSQVSPGTIKNYLQVLEDTLIGFALPGFTRTRKRKAISRGKHYLFDLGVTNVLCQRGEIKEKSELFGRAFEHFLILEMRAYLSYTRRDEKMTYWRSTSQFEVDLLVGTKVAIEFKATHLIQERHLKGLLALREEGLFQRYIVVSLDPEPRQLKSGISVLPWDRYLQDLWNGKII